MGTMGTRCHMNMEGHTGANFCILTKRVTNAEDTSDAPRMYLLVLAMAIGAHRHDAVQGPRAHPAGSFLRSAMVKIV